MRGRHCIKGAVSKRAKLSQVVLVPTRPNRPLPVEVAKRLIVRSRRKKSPNSVDTKYLLYRQLSTAVIAPVVPETAEGKVLRKVAEQITACAWTDYLRLSPNSIRISSQNITRLVTLSKRELKMKRTTQHRIVSQRLIYAVGKSTANLSFKEKVMVKKTKRKAKRPIKRPAKADPEPAIADPDPGKPGSESSYDDSHLQQFEDERASGLASMEAIIAADQMNYDSSDDPGRYSESDSSVEDDECSRAYARAMAAMASGGISSDEDYKYYSSDGL